MRNVIQQALDLLTTKQEWITRYEGYLRDIWNNPEKVSKNFNKPRGLSLYSTIADRKNLVYQLRFRGQKVGIVRAEGSSVILESEVPATGEYFKDCPLKKEDKEKDWNSKEARAFRSYFYNLDGTIATKSAEHVVENLLLEELRKKSSSGKALINIQPVRLHGQFFQMPTPFSASGKDLKYAEHNGGGIDILARMKTSDNHIRLCVMEVKDENKPAESQRKAMSQAVAYASFIAKLVKEQPKWWEILSNHNEEKDNTAAILDQEHIEVVTIMPIGTTETCEDEDFEIEELGITLHCRSLYYDNNKYKAALDSTKSSQETPFEFSGTFLDEIKK